MILTVATAAHKLSAAYWRRRAVRQAEQQMQADEKLVGSLKKEYDRILRELDDELAIFYARYAENESVSLAAARKLLQNAELEDFRMTLDEFRDKAIEGGYDKELNEIYLRTRVSRLQALQTQIELRMQELFQTQQELLHDHLAGVYTDTYCQTVYSISQQAAVRTSFARMDTDTVEKLLSKPWLDSDFSSRIWADKDKLLRELETALSRSFVRGDPLQRTTKQFAERMGVSESRAATLIHTESAHAAAEATAKGYKETGVSEYQFDASLDLKTCAVCGALDGKTFPVSARETGVSYPPIHPRCRCTTVPVTEFDTGGQRAARNPETGKTEYVDQGMTYEDWYEKYVAGDPEAEAQKKMADNASSDKKQYARYLQRLGSENVPKSFASFQKIKYNEPEKWSTLQQAYKDQPIRDRIQSGEQPLTILTDKQGKHIRGHKNYTEGRSYLTITQDDAQKLIRQYAGTGELRRDKSGRWTNKEFVTAKQMIGVWVNQNTGEERKTHRFTIHYAKNGTHIVPAEERR